MSEARLPSTALRVGIGVAAAGIGVAIFLAAVPVQTVAILTGAGIALIGVATVFGISEPARLGSQAPGSESRKERLWSRAVGALLLVFGAAIALWPDSGTPVVAFLVGAALLLHGALSAWHAFRGARSTDGATPADMRVTALISALASIILGGLSFTWPVLTLVVFRLGIGVWLVFSGAQLILSALRRDERRAQPARPASRLGRWARTIGATLSLLLALGAAAGSGFLLGGAPLPQPGPFYTPPADVPDHAGALIRSEPLTDGVPAGAEAWRILYTTTRPDGSPAISSGTVIAPARRGADPLPLLSIAHGTTGVVAKCAPSLSATPFADGAGAALTQMVTEHGWIAITSDYVGLGTAGTHPYLIGDAEARNVLDASRAVQDLEALNTTPRTVVWGHSQGGQAALWTGQIASEYAPDLTIEGVAAFAPAADLYGLAEVDKDDPAGKTVSAYIASTWDRIYPDLELEEHLTPGSAGAVEKIHDLCFNGQDVLGAVLRGSQTPNQVFPNSLLEGEFGDRLKAQAPTGPFPAPVLVAQGLADPLVRPGMQLDWVSARCKAGAAIDYRTYPGLDHNSLVAGDSPLTPQVVRWTLDRWEGKQASADCSDLPDSRAD